MCAYYFSSANGGDRNEEIQGLRGDVQPNANGTDDGTHRQRDAASRKKEGRKISEEQNRRSDPKQKGYGGLWDDG